MKQLWQIYDRYSLPDRGGDKGTLHSYIDLYAEEMTKLANIDLLEIGVWEGHSLAMWQDYFRSSNIVGIDVNLSRLTFDVDARQCDATNPEAIKQTLQGQTFDYIIDDGSHIPADQAVSFSLLWDSVKPGGKYFIEDIAGDEALQHVAETVNRMGVEYVVHDLRHVKNRFDDLVLVAVKP